MGPTESSDLAQRHLFDLDTEVVERSNGEFAATVTDRWNRIGAGPNGGYLLAVCLQALARTLPFPDPLIVSAFFLRPALVGSAEVQTEFVRAGRRMGTAEARLVQHDKERVRVVATFTDLTSANGRTTIIDQAPELPPPDRCIDPLAGQTLEGVTIAERVEYRMPELPGWLIGTPSGQPTSELWARLKDGREPDLMSLPLMVDAAAPAVLELGEFGTSTLELTVHLRNRPAPGWLACRIGTRYVIDGIHEEDFEIWDSRGKLVAQARQLAVLSPG